MRVEGRRDGMAIINRISPQMQERRRYYDCNRE
jgi:hypothetical protein